jgi:hypothetical protein
MTDENKSYRVTDRRHSTREEESTAEAPVPAQAAAESSPTVLDEPRSDENVPEPPADLIGLVVSLGTQAGMLLGSTEPGDVKGARWLISILEMLQQKTEGHRTDEESQALDGLLYQLRLAYVKRMHSGVA